MKIDFEFPSSGQRPREAQGVVASAGDPCPVRHVFQDEGPGGFTKSRPAEVWSEEPFLQCPHLSLQGGTLF